VERVLQVLLAAVLICTFLASLRIALVGLGHPPDRRALGFLTNDYWCLSLFIFLPWHAGSFARGETSPLPWVAYVESAARHGTADGLFAAVTVLIVEMWLLWIPAHSYIRNRPGLDQRTIILVRCLNLAIGLLLLTPQTSMRSGSSSTMRDWGGRNTGA
jgi:hypothetical protein